MASTALKGIWQLLLFGFLLSTSVVFGSNHTTVAPTSGAVSTAPTSALTSISVTTQPTATSAAATAANSSAQTTTNTSPAVPSVSPSTVPPTGATTQPISTTTGAISTASVSPSSVTTSSAMSPMSSTTMGNSTGSWMNGTTGSNSSMSMISCPSFMCNYSDCYSMYMSQNTTKCPAGYNYCELIRQMGVCYTVSCSAFCSMSCGNTSQSNCSVNCCNSTDCLNDTFASMMRTTTTPTMTTTSSTTTKSPITTTTVTVPTTQGGNICKSGKCNGKDCYTGFDIEQVCSSSQIHCQLIKETVGTSLQWTAGCTTNCSGKTSCKASTQPPCHLECCNATAKSCLMLNGMLNVPSFASRGPQLNSQLVTSVLVVFVISLML